MLMIRGRCVSVPLCDAYLLRESSLVRGRMLALPKPAAPRSLTNLPDKLIKIGAKVVSHARILLKNS
jgi:hypothetical protein